MGLQMLGSDVITEDESTNNIDIPNMKILAETLPPYHDTASGASQELHRLL